VADIPQRERRKRIFDDVAELYDRARPSYPPEVIDDLVSLAGLQPGSRLVEIGCGTGQATTALAERGLSVTCVELGRKLATIARRNLARFPDVEVVNAEFERWRPPRRDYDGIVAFTAFHWIDPARRYDLVARVLRPGGALAFVDAHHVYPPGGDSTFVEAQADYKAAGLAGDHPPPSPDVVADLRDEIEASGLFAEVTVHRHLWTLTQTADEYLDVLATTSDHRLIPEETRSELLRRLRRRIEARPGGTVEKTYLAVVHVARRA
jgi:SAM-dependent methyltransferase